MSSRGPFRVHERRPLQLVVTLRANAQYEASWVGHSVDLGMGGACVELPTPFPLAMDQPVCLELTSPTLWDPLLLDGALAWIAFPQGGRIARVGVRFLRLDPASLLALFDTLTARPSF